MSEMVARVAKAIFASQANHRSLDKVDRLTRESVLMAARAAIAAMRYPSKEMMKAGVGGLTDCVVRGEVAFVELWDHVIDEALK